MTGQKPDATGVPDVAHTSGLLLLLRPERNMKARSASSRLI